MPTYDYQCQECGKHTKIQRSFSDSSEPACAICGSHQLMREYSSISQIKSEKDRITDLSWVDKNLAGRIKKKKAGDRLNPRLKDAADRKESK